MIQTPRTTGYVAVPFAGDFKDAGLPYDSAANGVFRQRHLAHLRSPCDAGNSVVFRQPFIQVLKSESTMVRAGRLLY